MPASILELALVLPMLAMAPAGITSEPLEGNPIAGCVPMDNGYVGVLPGAACRVLLPGTSLTAAVPSGWVCETASSASLGDESLNVLMCLPAEGGAPISLQKMFDASAPDSLQTYLQRQQSSYSKLSVQDVRVPPHLVDLSGRPAVEAAVLQRGIAHGVDGTASEVAMVEHTIVFGHDQAFYECRLSAGSTMHDERARATHRKFCESVRFIEHAPQSANP